jgi:hypothetical protein
MNEEVDPKLLTLFAAANEPLDGTQFLASTLDLLERRLRRRALYRAVAASAVIIAAAAATPWLLDHTAWIFTRLFSNTTWIWIAPMPIALLLILRYVRLRR